MSSALSTIGRLDGIPGRRERHHRDQAATLAA
jgi:hypothetical protein